MIRHPRPATIGTYVIDVGKILRDEIRHEPCKTHCRCVECTAHRLAQIGWHTTTTSDGRGGTRTIIVPDENGDSDRVPVTGVEAAAIEVQPYAGIDDELARVLRVFWRSARMVEDKITRIRKHESDTEQLAGLGDCVCCGRFCNPRKDPNDRRRHGLCGPCDSAWHRWKRARTDAIWLINWWIPYTTESLRPDFIRWRRTQVKADAA